VADIATVRTCPGAILFRDRRVGPPLAGILNMDVVVDRADFVMFINIDLPQCACRIDAQDRP
jgi:hypothetical protein